MGVSNKLITVFIIIQFFLFIVSGCTTKTSTNILELENQMESQKKEIEELKTELQAIHLQNEELENYKDGVSSNIQMIDRTTRGILKFIHQKDSNGLKEQYGFSFTEHDGMITFEGVTTNMPFDSRLAGYMSHIGYYNPQKDFIEIGYYFYDEDGNKIGLVAFKYDSKFQLIEIGLGDT